MEWWHWTLGLFGSGVLGIAAYSLKTLIDIKSSLAGYAEWAKGVDSDRVKLFTQHSRVEERLAWGAKKISTFNRALAVLNHRVGRLERKDR